MLLRKNWGQKTQEVLGIEDTGLMVEAGEGETDESRQRAAPPSTTSAEVHERTAQAIRTVSLSWQECPKPWGSR